MPPANAWWPRPPIPSIPLPSVGRASWPLMRCPGRRGSRRRIAGRIEQAENDHVARRAACRLDGDCLPRTGRHGDLEGLFEGFTRREAP